MERIQRRKGMTGAPARTVSARRRRWAIAGEHDPSFCQRYPPVMKLEGITILTLAITGGEGYENRPRFLGIEARWHRQDRHRVRRHRVAPFRNVGSSLGAQGYAYLHRGAGRKRHAFEIQTRGIGRTETDDHECQAKQGQRQTYFGWKLHNVSSNENEVSDRWRERA